MSEHPTTLLLNRISDNDAAALDLLVRRIMPRVERWVRRRRGPLLRSAEETLDNTQDVLIQLARYLPKVRLSDSDALDRILLRMIRNTLASRSDYLTARRRNLTLQQPLDPQLELGLDPEDEAPSPSEAAIGQEREARLRFALALMNAEEQEILMRRHYDNAGYLAIGTAIGVTDDAARLRCKRAEIRLGGILRKIEQGSGVELASEVDDEETDHGAEL